MTFTTVRVRKEQKQAIFAIQIMEKKQKAEDVVDVLLNVYKKKSKNKKPKTFDFLGF